MSKDTVAVVILNWNGADMLNQFLPSVVEYSSNDAQVYVADNGSTDNSLEIIKDKFQTVKTIDLNKNYGFAEGYNLALKEIEAEFYVLLNSDVEVSPNWIVPLLQHLKNHTEVAACQPKILSWKHKDQFEYAGAAGGYIDAYGYPFCRGRILSKVETDCGQYDKIRHIFWGTGAALMIRRDDWIQVGGLDGEFFAHMEEIDLCWRLRARGRIIDCVPQSSIYHVGGGTLNKENPRKTYLNFRNNWLMLYKNLTDEQLKKVMRVRNILDSIALLKYVFTGKTKNAKAIIKAYKDYKKLRPSFATKRNENLKKAVTKKIPEQMTGLLIYNFYLKRIQKFSKLKFFK